MATRIKLNDESLQVKWLGPYGLTFDQHKQGINESTNQVYISCLIRGVNRRLLKMKLGMIQVIQCCCNTVSDSIHCSCKPTGCKNIKNARMKLQTCHELRTFPVHPGPTFVVSCAQSCSCVAYTSDKVQTQL